MAQLHSTSSPSERFGAIIVRLPPFPSAPPSVLDYRCPRHGSALASPAQCASRLLTRLDPSPSKARLSAFPLSNSSFRLSCARIFHINTPSRPALYSVLAVLSLNPFGLHTNRCPVSLCPLVESCPGTCQPAGCSTRIHWFHIPTPGTTARSTPRITALHAWLGGHFPEPTTT